MAHSVHVTAVVALHNAGVPFDVITFRLHWSVDSVIHYVRECSSQQIGQLSETFLIGSCQSSLMVYNILFYIRNT